MPMPLTRAGMPEHEKQPLLPPGLFEPWTLIFVELS
jgi:hypothetical protein